LSASWSVDEFVVGELVCRRVVQLPEEGRGGKGRENKGGRGGLSGNVAEEVFCLKSAPCIAYSVVAMWTSWHAE